MERPVSRGVAAARLPNDDARMKPIEVHVEIAASPEAVWRVVSDVRNAAATVPAIRAIEVLAGPPEGIGMRWRETRILFGREATEVMEIAEWNPPRSYLAIAESHGARYRSRVTVTPAASGTRLAFTFESQGVTATARILGALLAPFMKGAVRKAFRADLVAIKSHCEDVSPISRSTGGPSAPCTRRADG